jgi:hypothetical protein
MSDDTWDRVEVPKADIDALIARNHELEHERDALRVRLETALPDEVCGDTLDRALKAERGLEAQTKNFLAATDATRAALARAARYEAALRDACDLAREGWGYASHYFREKWSAEERIAECEKALSPEPEAGE